jgi:hypothetical protein
VTPPRQSITFTREELESDEAFRPAEVILQRDLGDPPYEEAWCDVYGAIVEAVLHDLAKGKKSR